MEDRKLQLLKLVIENYIETATPIGSKFLIEHTGLNVSAATIRNEMSELEKDGLLTHPHTSAGRIPTERGWQLYVGHLMKLKSVNAKVQKQLNKDWQTKEEIAIKQSAKIIAEYVDSAVIVAFDANNVYYTGISYLFSQPEFSDVESTVNVSAIFDTCEEILPDLFNLLNEMNEPSVSIGSENPFGSVCGMVGTGLGKDSVLVILGPMRMDYAKALSTINYIQTLA